MGNTHLETLWVRPKREASETGIMGTGQNGPRLSILSVTHSAGCTHLYE